MMAYAPVSDGLCDHIKVLRLGRDIDAMALWCLGLAWVTRHETDGQIPRQAIDKLLVSIPHQTRNRWIRALVRVCFWEEILPDMYAYHDILDWQLSSSELRDLRAKKRRAGYLGGKSSGESRRQASASRLLERTGTHHSVPFRSIPFRSIPSAVDGGGQLPGTPPATTTSEEVALATGSDSTGDQPTAPLAESACAPAQLNGTPPPGSRYDAILTHLRDQHPEWPEPRLASEALGALSRAVAAERRTKH